MRSCSDGVSTVPGAIALQRMPLVHEIRGDRLGQADDRGLARAVDEAIGNALDRAGDRSHVDDAAAAVAPSIAGSAHWIVMYIARTLRLKLKSQSLGVQSRIVPLCT